MRSHDLLHLPCSFQHHCLHQEVLFKKNKSILVQNCLLNFIGYGCPIFHKIGNARGLDDLQIKGAGVFPPS